MSVCMCKYESNDNDNDDHVHDNGIYVLLTQDQVSVFFKKTINKTEEIKKRK